LEERRFYFSATTEDILEEWIIYLEFARAKAIYDEFVNNFGKI
jgi:adenylate cyclase 10